MMRKLRKYLPGVIQCVISSNCIDNFLIICIFFKDIPFLNVITREYLTFLAAYLVSSLASFKGKIRIQKTSFPAGTLRLNDVIWMSMRRGDVGSTSVRHYFYDMCPLGLYQMARKLAVQRMYH